jgi:hypothetical protein
MSQYGYLKPRIHGLLEHFNQATQAFVQNSPDLQPHEIFATLYEASLATAGQVIGSAFASNPEMNQVEMYNQAMNSLKTHTESYHKYFLGLKEQQPEEPKVG